VAENPCLEYMKHIVFPNFNDRVQWIYEDYVGLFTYQMLEEGFAHGDVDPVELKTNLARLLNELIEPVRVHFRTDAKASALLAQIRATCK